MKIIRCANCASIRHGKLRNGYCRKCYYWQRKLMNSRKDRKKSSRDKWDGKISELVLKELKWREKPLINKSIDALQLEAVIYALAKHCRSEVGYAIHSLLNTMPEQSRLVMYSILLSIAENIPTRRPLHSMLTPPKRGDHRDTWHEVLRAQ